MTGIDVADRFAFFTVTDIGLQPNRIAIDGEGRFGYVSLYGEGAIAVIDLIDGFLVEKIPAGNNPEFIAVVP